MTRRSSPAPGQYDLFGEDEAAERKASAQASARAEALAEWQADPDISGHDLAWIERRLTAAAESAAHLAEAHGMYFDPRPLRRQQ